jgi:hypothetical protein
MRGAAAVARLRYAEARASQLLWLVPIAFGLGLGASVWVTGTDGLTRSASADSVAFAAVMALAVLASVLPAAIGFPGDVRTGRAMTLLAGPVSRAGMLVGGALGYGAFAAVLLLLMGIATAVGLEVGGTGTGVRPGVRPYVATEPVGRAAEQGALVEPGEPPLRFRFLLPAGIGPGETLPVRFDPWPLYRGGGLTPLIRVDLAVGAPGHMPGPSQAVAARITRGGASRVLVPVPGDLTPGAPVELTLALPQDSSWALDLDEAPVEIGEAPEPFTWNVLKLVLCAVPLLLVGAAAGSLGATRFGAPTAVVLVLALVFFFGTQDFLRDAAEHVHWRRSRDEAALAANQNPPGPPVTDLQLRMADTVLFVVDTLPPAETFVRVGDLVDRRAIALADLGRPWAAGAGLFVLLTGVGWLLVRKREIVEGL